MPPVPVYWDYSLIADHNDFFDWVSTELRTTPELDARMKELPSEIRFLLAEEDGYSFLSPVGDVFFEAYRKKSIIYNAIPIYLSEGARRSIEAANSDELKIIEKVIRKLRDPSLRRNGSEQKHNSDCLVYPKGHRTERIFYFEDERGFVRVCDLTTSHESPYRRQSRRYDL